MVDDEPSMIESLKNVIDKFKRFTVMDVAYMVSDAKLILQGEAPHVIITDIKMPGGTGLELMEFVSQHYPEIVVIVVSGYDTFEYVRSAFLWGVEDYLLKPISPQKFGVFLERLEIKLNNQKVASEAKKNKKILPSKELINVPEDKKQVDEIEEYLIENLQEDNSIDTICKAFYITQPHLNKIFRKYKDCTYNEFLTSLKISKGKQLLIERQDLLIGTIAKLCGFSDQFYFSKVFKNFTGVSPSEFRKN